MTPEDFYTKLSQMDNKNVVTLDIPIKVGPQDAMAAKLLNWLYEQMPEDSTQGDLDDVLDAAKFWSTFWAAAFEAKGITKNDQTTT